MSALLNDLKAQGLLATTLVVLATEFGRTSKINENAGLDIKKEYFAPNGHPFKIGGGGTAIDKILA